MLIDGRPAGDYQLRGLRTATALLSQDHTLFPVPVRENIALGRPDDTVSQAAVEDAARLGGAHAFVSKLGKAYATDLQLSDRFVEHLKMLPKSSVVNLLDGALYTKSRDEKGLTYHEGQVNSFMVFTNGPSGTLKGSIPAR
jgi:hypothetical protein